MPEAVMSPDTVHQSSIRGPRRAAPLGVRGWTGRSAILAATTTPRPPIATTETGKTRVSGMRFVARVVGARTGAIQRHREHSIPAQGRR